MIIIRRQCKGNFVYVGHISEGGRPCRRAGGELVGDGHRRLCREYDQILLFLIATNAVLQIDAFLGGGGRRRFPRIY